MPILGDNTQGAESSPGAANRALLTRYVLAEDGTINSAGAYFTADSAAGSNAKFLIYSDNAGTPGTLLYASSGSAIPAGGGLVTFTLSGSLTAGNLWLGIVYDSGNANVSTDDGLSGQLTHMANGTLTYSSPEASWPGSAPTYDFMRVDAYVDYTAGAAATFEQEGFRFGADNGSESAHTFSDAQDANTTQPLSQNVLLRVLVNGTSDPASAGFKLKYQKNGAGGYADVPVGGTSSPTLSYGEASTLAYSASGGTSVAANYPANLTARSAIVMVIGQKPSTANGGTVTTPSGWTLQLSLTGANDGNTGGYTTTLGADTGNCNIFVFTKDTVTGSESGTLSVTVGTNNVCWAQMIRLQASDDATWSWAGGTGKDTSAGNVSIATGAFAIAAGDFVIGGMVIPTDVTTPAQFSAEALSQTGTTFGTVGEISEPDSTTGNDIGGFLIQAPVSSGSGSGAVTMTATAGGTTTNVRGPGFVLRARVAAVTREVYVATSANIAAGGEATTARLTAPSGKTTSDFVTGRRWDDENGSDAIDITVDDYTELEWCLAAQSPAIATDYFDFRVYAADVALDTYTVTPRWTIGTAGISGSITEAATADASSTASSTSSASITESGSAAESSVATGGGLSDNVTEAASASDSSAATIVTAASIAEAAAAADSYAYPAGSVVPALLVSIAKGLDSSSGNTTTSADTTGVTQLRIVVESQVNTLVDGSLTDNKSNAFVIESGPTTVGTFPAYKYVYRPTGTLTVGTGHTFTVNAAGSWASSWVVGVGPSAGGTVSVASDQTFPDTTKPYVTASITPAQDNALLIGWAGDDSTGANVAWAWTSPSSIISGATLNDHNSVWGGTLGQRTVNAAGSYSMEASNSGTGGAGGAIIFSFTEVTTGGGSQSADQSEAASASDSSSATGGSGVSQTDSATASESAAAVRSTPGAILELLGAQPSSSAGNYNNDYDLDGAGTSPQTVTITSNNGKSVMLLVLGNRNEQGTPTDNQSNSYASALLRQQGYAGGLWDPYDMRVYGLATANGGASHTLSVTKTDAVRESTIVAIATTGDVIQAHSIVARAAAGAGPNYTSQSVVATGPALLVAFWSGDGGLGLGSLDAAPQSGTGWSMPIGVFLAATAHIQHALAIKQVEAGTYTITWDHADNQGAILFLAAIQSSSGAAVDLIAATRSTPADRAEAAAATETGAAAIATSAARVEAAAAADAPAAQIATAAAATEPGTATDAGAAALTTSATRTEAGAAADASDGTNTGSAATVTEAASASDLQAAVATMLAGVSEPGSASDAAAAVLTAVAVAAEAAAAGDTQAAVATLIAAITEAGAGADSSDGSVAGSNSATVTEPATAGDTSAATSASSAARVESAAAADAVDATKATSAAQADAGAAGDAAAASRSTDATRAEAAAASDSSTATSAPSPAGVVEIAVAADAVSAVAALLATVLEAAAASDMVLTGGLAVASISEAASAADFADWLRNAVAGDPRVLSIEVESRTLTITAEDRRITLNAEARTITITADGRTRSI